MRLVLLSGVLWCVSCFALSRRRRTGRTGLALQPGRKSSSRRSSSRVYVAGKADGRHEERIENRIVEETANRSYRPRLAPRPQVIQPQVIQPRPSGVRIVRRGEIDYDLEDDFGRLRIDDERLQEDLAEMGWRDDVRRRRQYDRYVS